MATETIKHPPLTGSGTAVQSGTARTQVWLRQFWARLMANKKKLFVGGGIFAAVLLAGFYFWGNDSSSANI